MWRARWCTTLLLTAFHGLYLAAQVEQNPAQLNAEAKAAAAAGNLALAEQKYRAVIQLEPRLAPAYSNLGRFFFEQGSLEKAIDPLQRATELAPNLEAPRALLGFVYFQMGKYKLASQSLATAIRLSPSDHVAKLFLARSVAETGDLRAACALLEQLHHDDPNNPEVLYSLGSIYSGLASATLARIQTAAPDSYLLDLLVGRSLETKQQYEEAAEHYKKAIAKAPTVAELYYHYAHAVAAAGDAEASLAAYREALAHDPYNPDANWEAARILVHSNPQEALRLADRALAASSDIPEAHMERGRALLELGRPKDASVEFQASIALNPDDEAAHFQLAKAYRAMGLVEQENAENQIFLRMQREHHAASEKSTTPAS